LPAWLIFSVLAMFMWGLSPFFGKLATRTLDPLTTLIYQQAGSLIVVAAVVISLKFRIRADWAGVSWGVVSGFMGTAAMLCFLQGVTRHTTSTVVMVTGLAPLVTVLLSMLFLRESMAPIQWVGVLFALAAIALISVPAR
jgi:bacterial/archaeal transporter family protein